MRFFLCFAVLTFSLVGRAEDVFRIEIGKNYEKYSEEELRRRVWSLERAVWQLQQRVFELETGPNAQPTPPDTWLCTIEAMGKTYTGTGGSKVVAKARVIEACKEQRDGNAFFCDKVKCEK